MATRYLYIARHGDADALGHLTDIGREQSRLLGRRLAPLPIDTVWHSPLPRAVASAAHIDLVLDGNTQLREAPELVDNVPYVPTPEEAPQTWAPFFDGYSSDDAEAGLELARSLTARFATAPAGDADLHEVVVTHAYPLAWLVRDALDAPPVSWIGLSCANAALTVIEYRPEAPAAITMVNDMSHLGPELRWTGFPPGLRA